MYENEYGVGKERGYDKWYDDPLNVFYVVVF